MNSDKTREVSNSARQINGRVTAVDHMPPTTFADLLKRQQFISQFTSSQSHYALVSA